MIASKEYVKDLLKKVFKKFLYYKNNDYEDTFKFGIDDKGEYGYIKDGNVIPFRYVHPFKIIQIISQDNTNSTHNIPDDTDFIIICTIYPLSPWNRSLNTKDYDIGGVLNNVGESLQFMHSGNIGSVSSVTQVITWETKTTLKITRSSTSGLTYIYCCKYNTQ